MIIDVIDLNFSKLNFTRSYDTSRFNRGRLIHRDKLVEIREVNKIDEDHFEVKAIVDGNYALYKTELKIESSRIIKSSCTCEDYRKGNLCKHIIATSFEILKPHMASTKEGMEKLQKEKEERRQKQLQEAEKRRQEERRRQQYESKYYNGLRTIEQFKNDFNFANRVSYGLYELYDQVMEQQKRNSGNLATNVRLEYVLRIEGNQNLKVSFKIGQTRMYVLKDIDELYEAYKNEKEVYYGKQLRFIPKRDNFAEDSRKIFDYIMKCAKMLEYNSKYDNYGRGNAIGKYMYIPTDEIKEFFNINANKDVLVETDDNNIKSFEFTDEKLDISCSLKKENIVIPRYSWYFFEDENEESMEYVLRLNLPDYLMVMSDSKIYVFCQNKVYTLDKERSLVKLFNLFAMQDKIVIPEDRLEDFKNYVLPQINYFREEDLPESMVKEGVIVNKLSAKILLDTNDDGDILLGLKFCYMDYEFDVSDSTYLNEKSVVRDVPAESEIIKRLFMDGFIFERKTKQFIMENTGNIYEFLLYKIEGYMNDFEVLATDKFKNKQIRQPKISNIGIRVDNGLLQLDISKINIDIGEIKSVLKDYSVKKKYHKLKNGDLLDLNGNSDLSLLMEMEATLDIDYSKVMDGVVTLPMNKSLYLEKLALSNQDIIFSKNERFNDLINNVANSELSGSIEIDKDFESKLRDYQKVGYRWLKTLASYKFGGILADDMGLGKTLQIIALLKSELELESGKVSIVVCPSTLVLNWKAEVEKWCDSIKMLIVNGNADERREFLNTYQDYDLIITSYDLLKRDIENYSEINFKFIIADEAQYIKNSLTQNATSLKSLNGEIKFALTGTPIENSVAELWSIFDFIMPGYLYNYNRFKKKFEEPILKQEDEEALKRLKKLISPFVLRRVKKDVLTELPEKNITVMKNEMEEKQQKIYLSYLAQTRKEVAEQLSDSSFEKSKFKILLLLTRLRQICCHPSLFLENYDGESGKMKQCIDLVKDAISSGHKILLFSSYTSMFEIIEKEFEKFNIKYFKLIGQTPVSKRIEMVEKFNNDESIKVFLISLKAGGTGLNLTSADMVIHYDPWWNLSSENQATDRAYRIGQKNSVQVYKLITNNSIEEKINKMQERKEKLSKDVLSTEETFINKMSKEEILDLFA